MHHLPGVRNGRRFVLGHTSELSHLLPDLGTMAASHRAHDDANKLPHPTMPRISVILT